MTRSRFSGRKVSASLSIEIAITALLMVIFAILAFDMLVVTWGYSTADAAARDAARAAASTGSAAQGLQAAQQAALAHKTDGYFVTQPTVKKGADFVYVTPATGSPYVTVTTRCSVRLPVPISFFGAQMIDGLIPYARTYTFPILGVPFTPNPAAGAAPPPVVAPPAPAPVPVPVPVPVPAAAPAPAPAAPKAPAPAPAPAPKAPAPAPAPAPKAPAPAPAPAPKAAPAPPPPPPPPPAPPGG